MRDAKIITQLFENGVPICLKCAEKQESKRRPPNTDQIRTTLVGQVVRAASRVSDANQTFSGALSPSHLPHPDGVQRTKNASNELNVARKNMFTAQKRLSDFLERGIVPEELKRSG